MARLVDAPDDNAVETTEELGNLNEMASEQAAEIAEAEPTGLPIAISRVRKRNSARIIPWVGSVVH